MFTITWDEHEEHCASVAEVDTVLDRLHQSFLAREPTLVAVQLDETGDCLSIGLGAERSVLNFVRGHKEPPYFTSLTGQAESDEPIHFRFGGEWSEYPLRNTVPTQLARHVIRRFCETSTLPSEIDWEEV